MISVSKDPSRDPFTKAELEIIFGPKGSANKRNIHPHHRWVPLMALFTGARIEELCQLDVADIVYVEPDDHIQQLDKSDESAILGFMFQENGAKEKDSSGKSDKSIKNTTSIRFTPMHPLLIELGFLEYVEAVKRKRWKKLFQYIPPTDGKYSHKVSQWFSDHLKECGVKTTRKTFHSFRYTVIGRLKGLGFTEELANAIAGHTKSGKTTSFKYYGGDYDPLTMKKALERFDYAPSISILRNFNIARDSKHARALGL